MKSSFCIAWRKIQIDYWWRNQKMKWKKLFRLPRWDVEIACVMELIIWCDKASAVRRTARLHVGYEIGKSTAGDMKKFDHRQWLIYVRLLIAHTDIKQECRVGEITISTAKVLCCKVALGSCLWTSKWWARECLRRISQKFEMIGYLDIRLLRNCRWRNRIDLNVMKMLNSKYKLL